MKKIIFILLLLLVFKGKSQFLDTLQELFKHKYSIDARLESRNSFIDHQLISVNGVRLGVSFKRKFRIGGGFSWLDSQVRSSYNKSSDTSFKFLKFVYLSYYVDAVFYKTKRWQLSVPLQAGTGLSWFNDNPNYSFKNRSAKYILLLYEPGISAQFKIFKWLGLGTDIAYRFTLKNNRRTAEQLNSPTYSFKLLFWPDQLIYDLFPKSIMAQKWGPAYW